MLYVNSMKTYFLQMEIFYFAVCEIKVVAKKKITVIQKVGNDIGVDKSKIGIVINQKFENITEKNTGYKVMKNILTILERRVTFQDDVSEELSADEREICPDYFC